MGNLQESNNFPYCLQICPDKHLEDLQPYQDQSCRVRTTDSSCLTVARLDTGGVVEIDARDCLLGKFQRIQPSAHAVIVLSSINRSARVDEPKN
jgi:hypothetical protein